MVELREIFDIEYGNQFDLNKMTLSVIGVNFISRSAKNNGLSAVVRPIKEVEPYDDGSITVTMGGSLLSAFIQPKPFYTAQNIKVLTPKSKMDVAQKAFYCVVIAFNRFRYSTFGREANSTFNEILVPALDEIPEWIGGYDIEQFNDAINPAISVPSPRLDAQCWQSFKYRDLFEIERGRGPRKKDLDGTGRTPVITSSDSNNGLTAVTNESPTHAKNTIGVNRNGSVAEAFYQPEPFCSTEDVHIFTPKFSMNKYIAMFLCSLIKAEKYRYSYGRKWGITRMQESIIRLPATSSGEPDWEFMESYIKSLPFSSAI